MQFPTKLKVAVIPEKHIFEINGSSRQVSGVEGMFLDTLSKTLRFEYEITVPQDKQLGTLKNDGNWSGVVGMVLRKEADLGMGMLAMTAKRLQVIDFSVPYTMQRVRFLVRKPGPQSSLLTIFYPFEIKIWVAVLIIIIFLPIIFKFLVKSNRSIIQHWLKFFGNLLGQATAMEDYSCRAKVLLTAWYMFSLVIKMSYSTALLAFLTVPLQHKPIKNFQDLSEAVRKGTHKCYLLQGTSIASSLAFSPDKYISFLGRTVNKNGWYFRATEAKRYLTGNNAILDLDVKLKFLRDMDGTEKYMLSEESLYTHKMSVAVSYDFCCIKKLDETISRMVNAGLFVKYQSDELEKARITARSKVKGTNDHKQLLLKDVLVAFILLAIGYIISTVFFLLELLSIAVIRNNLINFIVINITSGIKTQTKT